MDITPHTSSNFFEWRANIATTQYESTDALAEILGIEQNSFHKNDFIAMVHPLHRDRVKDAIAAYDNTGYYNEQFQILTKHGYLWANSNADRVETNEQGGTIIVGHMSFMDENNVEVMQSQDPQRKLNELISHYAVVSNSLLDFLHQKDISQVIHKTLNDLLTEFGADRVYIIEYDPLKRTQSCTYEVVRESIEAAKDGLQQIPVETTDWWTEQLLVKQIPIICDNIEGLKIHAKNEYDILKQQDIISLMVVPLITKDGIGGYMGMDIVGKQRIWNNTNIQWFQSLANIISLCMGLKKSQERAEKEEARYRRLYENMPMGFLRFKVLYNDQGKINDYTLMEANQVAHSLFPEINSSSHGKLSAQLNDTDSVLKLETLDSLIKTRCRITGETKTTSGRHLSYTMYSIEHEEVIVMMQDNTDSITASNALRKSEETLSNIYKNIPIGIEIYDKDGTIISINDIELEIFGLANKDDAMGINLFDNPNVPRSFLDDLRNGRSASCDFFYDFDQLEGYYDCKYTGKKHIILKGSVIYDADNNVENYLLIVLDNTETLQKKNKIERFELLFNSIAEFSEVGLCQWNPSDHTITGTDQWYANLSIGKSNINEMLDAYVNAHPDDYLKLKQGFEDMLSGKIKSIRDEIRIGTEDNWKWLRTNYKVSVYRPQDNKVEIIGINIDITELKNTEHKLTQAKLRAEELDRLKSAFLANMSHELRTPLNAIVGFSDLLMDTKDGDEQQQYMNIIRTNNELLLQLISDILDISQIESGLMEISDDAMYIDYICEETVSSFPQHRYDEVPVIFDTPNPDITIHADRVRLLQVISNLVNNARKFTKSGSINIGYQMEPDHVVFYVKDTGIGIPKQEQHKIFTRFIKLNNFIPGTGLGLSICKSVIEKMGGKIWVESEPGTGSCFKFTLPYKVEHQEPA